jgi:phospholipase D1/2
LGLKANKAENSIQIAYIETIDRAKNFIYIENQFFISGTAGEPVKNGIAEALILRIRRAIERGESFVVFAVIPLLPGFEGAVEESKGTFTRIALGFQQETITKGPASIFNE